jgi:predicted dehydrogenase
LDATPGERIGVIGLGLLGQLTLRLASALGFVAFGLDIREDRVVVAQDIPGVRAWSTEDGDVLRRVHDHTNGHGLDGVIICAASRSDVPANLALDLCRNRGRVAVVGDVSLNLRRDKMYRKELEVRLSASYGPGRHDPEYEVEGRDYPLGFVRWTANRNLEAFLSLTSRLPGDISRLITARYRIHDAHVAYERVRTKKENDFCVLLEYETGALHKPCRVEAARTLRISQRSSDRSRIRLALVGVGRFASAVHIPNLKRLRDRYDILALVSQSGRAGSIAERVGARLVSTNVDVVLNDPDIDAVLIATRHSSHADLALRSLHAGKHVFVEKPMATTMDDCKAIEDAALSHERVVRVGFNRRFAPFLRWMRRVVGESGHRILHATVNVGSVQDHWSNSTAEGGRLLGEGVHFVDLCNWFMGMEPVAVLASEFGTLGTNNPNLAMLLRYPDTSLGVVSYSTVGTPALGKELYELSGNGRSARCDDFRTAVASGKGRAPRGSVGDKGQLGCLIEFADAVQGVRDGGGADARAGTLATWAISAGIQSANEGREILREI